MARPWARRFVRDQRGATLIEFGILAPVFFVLITRRRAAVPTAYSVGPHA